ncbi:glycosyltransferase [Vibrio sp. SCSIO 43137]|uniref:glycosyltransferase n=1 Tax=Vibrio sp. SCSIO 43137 TaxID=3021011 RepID=UPI002306F8C1|nr:glycosyltransferase [Vibrio sp. SCSIO 43137]WCE30914.1 glycosyltransferase [Vibrio sp. SCSIO 43137]
MSKPVSIVIITLNEEKNIGRLLGDLSEQTNQNFEVVLVDSNSEDRTIEVAAEYSDILPKLTIHKMKKRGASLGRNQGALIAKNQRLLFLDADVRLDSEFLEKADHELEKSGLEVAGVYMNGKGLSPLHRAGYSLFNAGFFVTQFIFPTAVGACIFSSKRVHKAIGGFDEKIYLCEDCDYVKRASKTWRFRFLPLSFRFDSRRLDQDGIFKTAFVYLRANLHRIFIGELRDSQIEYRFGHYSQ